MIPEFEAFTNDVEHLLVFVGVLIDVVAVAIITVGIGLAFGRFFRRKVQSAQTASNTYRLLKIEIGLALLLGLELLVAADVIKSVALEPTFTALGVLGLLVLIRTFLSWTLVLEIEGRWPWQKAQEVEEAL